jgi:hypothetical protein
LIGGWGASYFFYLLLDLVSRTGAAFFPAETPRPLDGSLFLYVV